MSTNPQRVVHFSPLDSVWLPPVMKLVAVVQIISFVWNKNHKEIRLTLEDV